MSDAVIDIQGVSKHFGSSKVLDSLTMQVAKGQTFAFLGRNGAGKTTTIRMLLGLLKPDKGTISVMGFNPAKDALKIRGRVGYMAEDQTMFGWMRVSQIIDFMAPFYPKWDNDLVKRYIKRFELPVKTKVKHLSKGQNARLGLLLALVHHPELVILDDPTLGLDPIMRKEFIRDVIDHLQGKGVSVFFSSHLLYEIEPVADVVAILNHGRIVQQAPTEQLREEVKQIIVSEQDYQQLGSLPGMLDMKRRGERIAIIVENAKEALPLISKANITPEVIDLNLDEIFEAYVIGKTNEQHNSQSDLERVA